MKPQSVIKKFLYKQPQKYGYRQIAKWLWTIWKGNRRQALLNVLVGLLGVFFNLCWVVAIKHAIDVASGNTHGNIYIAVALMAFVQLVLFALRMASSWLRNVVGVRAQNKMQQQMLDHLLRASWQGKQGQHSGDILNRLELDVSSVVVCLTETLPDVVSMLALLMGSFLFLLKMDFTLALVVMFCFPVFLLISKLYMGKMRTVLHKVRTSDSEVQSILQESVQHKLLIKTLESIDLAVNRLEKSQETLRLHVRSRAKINIFSSFSISVGFLMAYLIAFLWAALRIQTGSLTFGGMVAFLDLVNRINSPTRSLAQVIPSFASVLIAAERLMELEDNPIEKQGKAIYFDEPCGIRIKNMSYCYADEPDKKVIDNLSYTFPQGSCTAILGQTGAGKTTLIRLILALIEPTEGSICLFDNNKEQQLSSLMRCNIAYVPQGNSLMSGTIRENLLLGNLSATNEELVEALKMSCANFVLDLPNGLDTKINESGVGLSEGQAQRICIARALLRNRSIMIFDEATSALDEATEAQVLKNILATKNKTVLFITHRPAVMTYCNQVLRIESAYKEGEIKEQILNFSS